MKKVSILLAAFVVLTSFTAKDISETCTPEKPGVVLNKDEKKVLLDYYKETNKTLMKDLKGLSEAQLQYKTSPDRWSINQCMEHIVLVEGNIFGIVQKMMQGPANPERREEIKISDEDLIKGMTDRSKTAQAPDELQPSDKYPDSKEAIKAFEEQRAQILEYIKSADVKNMRNHVTDSPFGAVDAYQFTLFIAAHTARHTKQIEEVMADPGFPSE